MSGSKKLLWPLFYLASCLLLAGCISCIQINTMPLTPPSLAVTQNNVVFKCAILPNGNPAKIEVKDYCPSADGINEVAIGWSQSNLGAAKYAVIIFPESVFGDGPQKVWVSCAHFNACTLKAYDKNNLLLATAVHPGPQNTAQSLLLSGGRIARIEVIGAEIGIKEVCYEP